MGAINKKSETYAGIATLLVGLFLFWMNIAGYGSSAISFGAWDMKTWYLGLFGFSVSSATVLAGVYLIYDSRKK